VLQHRDASDSKKIELNQNTVHLRKLPPAKIFSTADALSKKHRSRMDENGESHFSETLLGEENISALQQHGKFSKIYKDHSS
jgi:hypothetical protein